MKNKITVKKPESSDSFDLVVEQVVNRNDYSYYVTDKGSTIYIYDLFEDRSLVIKRNGKWEIE